MPRPLELPSAPASEIATLVPRVATPSTWRAPTVTSTDITSKLAWKTFSSAVDSETTPVSSGTSVAPPGIRYSAAPLASSVRTSLICPACRVSSSMASCAEAGPFASTLSPFVAAPTPSDGTSTATVSPPSGARRSSYPGLMAGVVRVGGCPGCGRPPRIGRRNTVTSPVSSAIATPMPTTWSAASRSSTVVRAEGIVRQCTTLVYSIVSTLRAVGN